MACELVLLGMRLAAADIRYSLEYKICKPENIVGGTVQVSYSRRLLIHVCPTWFNLFQPEDSFHIRTSGISLGCAAANFK